MPKSNGNKKSLSLHLFFKTFFDSVKTQQDSLLELQNTLIEFKIARMTDTEGLIFESNDGSFTLKCVVSDKRSYSFINSIDDKSSNKRTDSDHIREYLYTFFCADNFSVIDAFAQYFKKFCSLSSDTYAFYEEFCKDSFDNSDKQRELTNFMESLESDSLRTAWMFAFLCFPKTPSEKNTDYRLLLLNKILQLGHTESKFQPLDITGNDKQIEKVNIADIGRSAELEEIKKEMLANNTVLVYGIGGIGKSYICRKLFWNYYDCFSDGIEYLAWIQYNGDLTQSVTSSFYDPETNLDNIRKKYENHPVIGDMFVKLALADKPDDKMQVIKEYFSKLEARLLVFIDNADTMTKEEKKWLNSCKCRMIITSRQKIDGFYGVNINSPSPAYCKEMYIRESRGNNLDGYSLDEDRYIEKITELANYHTQTVMLIAKAQYCLGLSSEDMLDELNNTGFVLKGNDEIIDTEEYELTMAEHLTKIFNLLNVTDETQLKAIRLFSLLAPNTPVKKRDIKKWFELKSLSSINELVKYGWLNSSGSEYVSIHPVIADVLKYNYKPDFEFALPLINALQEEMKAADDYNKKNAVIVHAVTVEKVFDDVESKEFAAFLDNIAETYYYNGAYNESMHYYQKSLSLQKKILGTNHHDTALSYNKVGTVYRYMGNYEKALEFLFKSIAIQERVLGTEHPDTALSYNNVGNVYCVMGNYEKALEYNFKSMTIRERVFGTEHPYTANSYNNISIVYIEMGNYENALEYLLKSISIQERVLGTEYQDTAESYYNVGVVYCDMGNYEKALEFYNKALSIQESVLGAEHPDTAHSYNSIGIVYSDMGNYEKALEFYNKALSIRERTLGTDHPDTAMSYNSIGCAYRCMGDFEKALKYSYKSIAIREKVFGTEHPYTANSYNNLGAVYGYMGNYEKALEFYNKALSIRERTLGTDHPDTAMSYHNIGIAYREFNNYEKAFEFLNKALSIREKVLGPEHLYTANSYSSIGITFKIQGDYEKALDYFNKSLCIRKKVLGVDHPDTIKTQNNINEIQKLLSEKSK